MAKRLPADVVVLTRAELVAKEQQFWENVAPIGVVFDIGLVMGFVVGLAICYQVLYSEIADRLAAVRHAQGDGVHRLKLLRIRDAGGRRPRAAGLRGLGLGVSLVLFRVLQATDGHGRGPLSGGPVASCWG